MYMHYLLELARGLKMPDHVQRHLAFLNPYCTITRYPNAASGVPYNLYDRKTALSKVRVVEEVIGWLQKQINE